MANWLIQIAEKDYEGKLFHVCLISVAAKIILLWIDCLDNRAKKSIIYQLTEIFQ